MSSSNDKSTQKKKIKNHHYHNRFGCGGVFGYYCRRNQRLLFVSFVVLSTILHLIIHNSAIDDLTAKSKADVDVNVENINRDIKIDNDDENNNIQRQLIKNNMTTTSPTSLYHNNNVNNNTTSFPSPSSAAAAAAASQQQQQKQTSDATVTATAATKTVWLNDHLHHLWNNNISNNPSSLSSSTSIGLLLVEIPSSYKPPKGINRICSTWNISIDDWWVHNYRWKIVKETTTEYCLEQWLHQAQTTTTATTTARRQLEFKNRIKLYRMLYKNQFGIDNVDCSQTISKYMWSTGWGADFLNVIDGLGYGLTHGVPFVVNYNKRPWHYSRDVMECNEPGTINCYFLNYSKCNNNSTNVNVVNETMLDSKKQFLKNNKYISDILYETNNRYIYEWITRPKTWLRRKVVDFIEPYLSKLPFKQCTVIHVRRGDVVLHGKVSRRYFEIHEYVSALEDYRSKSNVTTSTLTNNDETKTMIILLLTDDANAIMEAKTLYPNYTWITIDRSRYQGSEGGFEGHFPSNDALKETIVLLGTFQLVQRCTTLIHTHSNLAQLFYGYMLSEHGKKNLNRIEIGSSNTNHTFNTKNTITVNISRSEF